MEEPHITSLMHISWIKGIFLLNHSMASQLSFLVTTQCSEVPKLQFTIANYTLVDSFYVVDVADTNLVLGVKWLYSIGERTVNYQIPKMKFQYSKHVQRVVRGEHTYPNQIVT